MISSAGSRIWEPFLTEQDRAHLALARDRRVGFGRRPALLFIDLYRWVFGDEPEPLLEAVNTWPGSCGLAAWEAVPHLQRLLALAREVGLPAADVLPWPTSKPTCNLCRYDPFRPQSPRAPAALR